MPTATKAPEIREKRAIPGMAQLQRVGRSLMLPIASLPAAALLLRLGQPDMLGANGLAGALGSNGHWRLPVATSWVPRATLCSRTCPCSSRSASPLGTPASPTVRPGSPR
jgi:hypothetical protein